MSAPVSPERIHSVQDTHHVTVLDGITSLTAHYDGFLLDQWGVLHDGIQAYPGALDAIRALRQAGKKIIILSNSGRNGSENEALLARLGFARSLYDMIVSAGDDARDALIKREFAPDLGSKCFLLVRHGESYLVDGLGLEVSDDIERADFIFNLSMDPARQSVAGWMPTLAVAAKRGLLMICGNPDHVRVAPGGELLEAPGAIAQAYERLGGKVAYHGKPYPRIYTTCLRLMDLPEHRVAAIGDSLKHDVTGAKGLGVDSVLVAGGIHRNEFVWRSGIPTTESCAHLFKETGIWPDYVVPTFSC